MKELMKEVLDMVATSYTIDTRAIEWGECKYLTEDGRMCAIGKLLDPNEPEYVEFARLLCNVEELLDGRRYLLQVKYQNLPMEFLQDIQKLHDDIDNWNKEGLSETGEVEVERIKGKHGLI